MGEGGEQGGEEEQEGMRMEKNKEEAEREAGGEDGFAVNTDRRRL